MREPQEADRALIDAAREALFEITDPETVGALIGLEDDTEGVVEVFFHSTMPGYPGWRWNVSVSVLDGSDAPSVLETELVPGDDALLAPEWVPWADRLADYRAAQADAASDEGDDAEDDDDDDDDDDDEEDDESDLLDADVIDDSDDDIDGVDFEGDPEDAELEGEIIDEDAGEAEQDEDLDADHDEDDIASDDGAGESAGIGSAVAKSD